jgi:hypothetical protein
MLLVIESEQTHDEQKLGRVDADMPDGFFAG